MVRLRGHHLICLHFFRGEGYEDIFIENLRNVLKRIETEDIEVCEAADAICEKCPYVKGSKCLYDRQADDEIREMDKAAISFLGIDKNARITWQKIKGKIPEIFLLWYRDYCSEGEWRQGGENDHYYRELKD